MVQVEPHPLSPTHGISLLLYVDRIHLARKRERREGSARRKKRL